MQAVLAHYNQATDKDNPNRNLFEIAEEMSGKIHSTLKSFNLLDNPKYQ